MSYMGEYSEQELQSRRMHMLEERVRLLEEYMDVIREWAKGEG